MKAFRKEYNHFKDAVETYYWDEDKEKLVIKNTFNVSDILETNKRMQNASIDSRFGNKRMHHVAEIPMVFISKLLREHNIDVFNTDPTEQKRLRRVLETPEYRHLKSTVKKLWRPT